MYVAGVCRNGSPEWASQMTQSHVELCAWNMDSLSRCLLGRVSSRSPHLTKAVQSRNRAESHPAKRAMPRQPALWTTIARRYSKLWDLSATLSNSSCLFWSFSNSSRDTKGLAKVSHGFKWDPFIGIEKGYEKYLYITGPKRVRVTDIADSVIVIIALQGIFI